MSGLTFLRNYAILKVWETAWGIRTFVAERMGEEGGSYLINEISDRTIIDKYIPALVRLKNGSLPEFAESFTQDSKLYSVFNYDPGADIKTTFEEKRLDFNFRVELLVKILERLAQYENAGSWLKATALLPENIVFEENRLNFNFRVIPTEYDLSESGSEYTALLRLMKLFFSEKEIGNHPSLKVAAEKCEKGIYHSIVEVLKDLSNIYTSISKEQKLKAILEEKREKLGKWAARAGVLAILVGIGYYVYTTYFNVGMEAALYSDVEKIGTVSVEGFDTGESTYVYIENGDGGDNEKSVLVDADMLGDAVSVDGDLAGNDGYKTKHGVPYKIYIVKGEDNLSRIAFEEYGTSDYTEYVRMFNGIGAGDMIDPGQEIKLPMIQSMNP